MALKILIVDDEALVRVGIKTILQAQGREFEIAGEAGNGQQALELARTLRPDIVLVDIRMPVMNGLDFISLARQDLPQCKFIVLSCVSRFETAKAAMKLGVRDYILKSAIDSDELMEVLKRVAGEISAEGRAPADQSQYVVSRPVYMKERLSGLLDGAADEKDSRSLFAELGIGFPDESTVVAVLDFGIAIRESGFAEPRDPGLMMIAAANICNDVLGRYCMGHAICKNEYEIAAILFPAQSLVAAEPEQPMERICSEFIHSIDEYLNIKPCIGYGGPCGSSRLREAYAQAQAALKICFYKGPGGISAGSPASLADSLAQIRPAELYGELQTDIIKTDFAAVSALMGRVSGLICRQEPREVNDVKAFYFKLVDQALDNIKDVSVELKRLKDESHVLLNEFMECRTMDSLARKCLTALNGIMELYRQSENNYSNSLIARLKEYVLKNMEHNVTLATASEYLQMNPSYLSKLFKVKTGENFSDFVMKEKIRRSKELLQKNEKLWVIAQKTGYSEIAALSRAFKKVEGISPKQYRARVTGKA